MMNYYYEAKAKVGRWQDNGMLKAVSETYLVHAGCFSQAEDLMIREIIPDEGGGMDIQSIKLTPYGEILIDNDDGDYFAVRIEMVVFDEEKGKDKKVRAEFMLQSDTVDNADRYVRDKLSDSLIPIFVVKVEKTTILGVIENGEKDD